MHCNSLDDCILTGDCINCHNHRDFLPSMFEIYSDIATPAECFQLLYLWFLQLFRYLKNMTTDAIRSQIVEI